jgi:hypothetical protein
LRSAHEDPPLGYVGVGSARAKEWSASVRDPRHAALTEPDDGVTCGSTSARIASLSTWERATSRYVGWEVASLTALTDAVEELRGKGVSVERLADECQPSRRGPRRVSRSVGIRHELFYGQRSLMSFRPTRDISDCHRRARHGAHRAGAAGSRGGDALLRRDIRLPHRDFIDLPFPSRSFT